MSIEPSVWNVSITWNKPQTSWVLHVVTQSEIFKMIQRKTFWMALLLLMFIHEFDGKCDIFGCDAPANFCEDCLVDIAISNFQRGSLVGFVLPRLSDANKLPLNCTERPIDMDTLIKEMQWTFLIRTASINAYDLNEVNLYFDSGMSHSLIFVPDCIKSDWLRGQLYFIHE